jgi:hypothetical protein
VCRDANPAYLKGFLFSALPSFAPYCVPGGIRVVSADQVDKYSAFYKSAVVPECFDRAAIFSACRWELLLVCPTFGAEILVFADRSGIKDTLSST